MLPAQLLMGSAESVSAEDAPRQTTALSVYFARPLDTSDPFDITSALAEPIPEFDKRQAPERKSIISLSSQASSWLTSTTSIIESNCTWTDVELDSILDEDEFNIYCLRSVMWSNYMEKLFTRRLCVRKKRVLDVMGDMLPVGMAGIEWEFTGVQVIEEVSSSEAFSEPIISERAMKCQENVLIQGIPLANGSLDYIHHRVLAAGIPTASLPKLLISYNRLLRPKYGILEFIDSDAQLKRTGEIGTMLQGWLDIMMENHGFVLPRTVEIKEWMAEAGFVNMQESAFRVMQGCANCSWSIEDSIRKLNSQLILEGLVESSEQIEDILEKWREECQSFGTYVNVVCVIASKQ